MIHCIWLLNSLLSPGHQKSSDGGAAESKSIGSGSTGMGPVPVFLEEIITAREREPEKSR